MKKAPATVLTVPTGLTVQRQRVGARKGQSARGRSATPAPTAASGRGLSARHARPGYCRDVSERFQGRLLARCAAKIVDRDHKLSRKAKPTSSPGAALQPVGSQTSHGLLNKYLAGRRIWAPRNIDSSTSHRRPVGVVAPRSPIARTIGPAEHAGFPCRTRQLGRRSSSCEGEIRVVGLGNQAAFFSEVA